MRTIITVLLLACAGSSSLPAAAEGRAKKKCRYVQCFDRCCKQGEVCQHGSEPGFHRCFRPPGPPSKKVRAR